jgi:hypothetical protein
MIEVLKQSLDGMLAAKELAANHRDEELYYAFDLVIHKINEAIKELDGQKPFCYAYKENGEDFFAPKDGYYPADAKPLYTHPPQRTEPVAWDLADKVRQDLDRQSCPDAFMRIAVESIVKHHPPRRTWVGLTNEEFTKCWHSNPDKAMKNVEAKSKERNGYGI